MLVNSFHERKETPPCDIYPMIVKLISNSQAWASWMVFQTDGMMCTKGLKEFKKKPRNLEAHGTDNSSVKFFFHSTCPSQAPHRRW